MVNTLWFSIVCLTLGVMVGVYISRPRARSFPRIMRSVIGGAASFFTVWGGYLVGSQSVGAYSVLIIAAEVALWVAFDMLLDRLGK
jgi:L-asparagine transporter-like permease